MKKSNSLPRISVLTTSIALAGAMLTKLAAPSAHAVTYYWDNNGTAAGFGTAAGTWAVPTTGTATQGWSTSATGVTLPGDITTATTDLLNFGNGATGLAAGTITVSGTVDAGDMTFASGSGAIVLSGGTINLAAAEIITVNNAADTISSSLAGASTSLTKAGTGTLTLSGINTYTGATNVSAGTLTISDASTFTNTSAINLSGTGRLNVNVADQSLAKLASGTGVAAGTFLRYSAAQAAGGTGPGVILGTVELNLTNVNPNYTLDFGTGSNLTNLVAATYTSGITLSGNASITSSTAVFTGTGMTVSSSSAGAKTLTLTGTNTGANTISGSISDGSGTIGVTKTGAGTWILSGVNAYSGATNVNTGTLQFNSASAIGGSGRSVTVAAGATVSAGYAMDNGFLNRLAENANAFNVNVAFASANDLDFSSSTGANLPNAVLTGAGNLTYSGNLTPNGTTFRLGNVNTTTGFSNANKFNVGSLTVGLTGAGNSLVVSGTQMVDLTGSTTASSSMTYGGTTTINSGAALHFQNCNMDLIGGGAGVRDITVADGAVILRTGGSLNQAFLNRLVQNNNAFVIYGSNAGNGNNLDLTGFPNASLGLYDSVGTQTFTFTGTITPANNTYRFGGPRAGNNINLTNANTLTGARSVVVNGGNLRLMASMDYTGNTTITAGTFTIAGPVAALNASTGNGQIGGGNYAGAILNNGAVAHSSTFDQTLSGVISGTGSVTKTFATFTGGTSGTASTLTLSGANTYTGVTAVQAGTLAFSSIANVSGGSSNLGAPTTAANGTIAIGSTTNAATLRYTGSGHTSNRVINLAGTTGGATIDASGTGALVLTSAMTATGAGIKTLTLTGTNTGNNTIGGAIVNNSATNITSLVKSGTGTWVLTGANTYTGTTTISAGILRLDYSTNNTGKIQDGSVLTLAGGTLDLSGGSHTEIVASTTLTAGTASRVTSSTLGSVLQMNTITPNIGATINFAAANIATTDNTNTNDILGPWATFGGTDWAKNSTNAADGPITAYTGYTDIAAQGPGSTIADGAATNVRILADGTSGNIELGAATTTINTLLQSNANFAATINTVGKTQRTDGIWITSGKAALTVGAAVGDGFLTAATAGGNLLLMNDSASQNLTINAVVADNGSPSSLSKTGTGTLILNGANTHGGGTTLGAGTLVIGNDGALGSGAFTITGGAVAATGTIVTINAVNANGDFSIAGAGTLTLGDMTLDANRTITNNNTTGTTTFGAIFGTNTALTFSGAGSTDVTGSVGTGTGSLTKDGAGTLTLAGADTYSGATTVSGGTLRLIGNRFASAGRINVTSGALLEISNGLFSLGANSFSVGGISGTSAVSQNGGSISFGSGDQLILGNNTGDGIYDLSGGTLSTVAGTGGRGVILGTNAGRTGVFNVSDAGFLTMTSGSVLQIGRSDTTGATGTTGIFNQTGGTANVGDLRIGGASGAISANTTGTLNLSGGQFSAVTFTNLSGGNNSVSTIKISGAADVTLPAFPTTRGTGATATISFDGGTLRPRTASATYMGGLTNAFIKAGGATFDTSNGSITITQALLTDAVSLNGGLTKLGTNTLTLTGANTYTGPTTVSDGTLSVGVSANLGAAAANLVLDGGVLRITGTALTNFSGIGHTVSFISGKPVRLDIADAAHTFTVDQVLNQGSGSFYKYGPGTVILNQVNTYLPIGPGDYTDVIDGTLLATKYASLPNVAADLNYVETGATLAVRALEASPDGEWTSANLDTLLGGGGTTDVFNTGSMLGIEVTGTNSFTYANDIAGTSSAPVANSAKGLVKLGTGTLTITANNTYTGATNVNGGTLNVNGTLGTGSNVVNANAGATNFGTSQTLAALNVGAGAVVTLGTPAGAPAASGGEEVFAQQGEILTGGATQAVPEPGSAVLLLGGLVTLLGLRRRKA